MKIIGGISAQQYHRITDSLRLEKTSEIIKSNHGLEIGRKGPISFQKEIYSLHSHWPISVSSLMANLSDFLIHRMSFRVLHFHK